MSDSEPELENKNEVAEVEPNIEAKKLEMVIVRIGKCCLILSVLLFVTLVIVCSVTWRHDGPSIVTGFVFSILLFLIWYSINSVYGPMRTVHVEDAQIYISGSCGIGIRLRSENELKNMLSTKWLVFFGSTFILAGAAMIACEAYLMSVGLFSWYTLGRIDGSRIGYSSCFVVTGIVCFILAKYAKRVVLMLTLVLAITSLVFASILSEHEYRKSAMNSIDFATYRYGEMGDEFWLFMWKNDDGNTLFPFMPWAPITVLMCSFPPVLAAFSTALIFTSFHVTVELRPAGKRSEANNTNRGFFGGVGTLLVILGFLISLAMCVLPNFLNVWTYGFGDTSVVTSFIFTICGLLAMASSQNPTTARHLGLFFLSIGVLVSGIIYVVNAGEQFHNTNIDKVENCVSENGTELCVSYANSSDYYRRAMVNVCVPIEKRCDGILDFFNYTKIADRKWLRCGEDLGGSNDYTSGIIDEIYCKNTFVALYSVVFALASFGMAAALATIVVTWRSVLAAGRFAAMFVRQQFNDRVPLVNEQVNMLA